MGWDGCVGGAVYGVGLVMGWNGMAAWVGADCGRGPAAMVIDSVRSWCAECHALCSMRPSLVWERLRAVREGRVARAAQVRLVMLRAHNRRGVYMGMGGAELQRIWVE